MSELTDIIRDLWENDDDLRGRRTATAEHILATYSGKELVRIITPDLRRMLTWYVSDSTRDFAMTHATLVGASHPHGRDTEERISDDGVGDEPELGARIWVPDVGRLLVRDLTTEHCLAIATYQRRLSIMHVTTAERFEQWAKEIRDAGVTTLGELKTRSQSVPEPHTGTAAAVAAR